VGLPASFSFSERKGKAMKHAVYSLFLLVGFAFPIPALAANCPPSTIVSNGLELPFPSTFGAQMVTLDCSWYNSTYSGTVQRFCWNDGTWSSILGSCIPPVLYCPQQNFSSNGATVTFPETEAGQSHILSCASAGAFDGSLSGYCESNGVWDISGSCTPQEENPNPDPNPNPNPSGSPVAQALDSLIQPLNLGAVQSGLLAVGLLILAIFATFVAIRIALKLLRMWG
jgi:hypothetical protein